MRKEITSRNHSFYQAEAEKLGAWAEKRKELFESQDRIDLQRDQLIEQVERKLVQEVDVKPLFAVRWILS